MTTSAGKRIVLVTGASSGIGAATARALAARGDTVGLVARREHRLTEVLAECQKSAPESKMWAADLSDPEAAGRLARRAWEELGHFDVLVNNAGVPMRRPVTRLEPADIERVMRINFLSPTYMTLAVLPMMIERGDGVIVNVSSIASRFGVTTEAAYCASKFALSGWSEAIAADLDGTGVRVRLVMPGTIDTELWDQPGNDPPLYQGPLTPAEDVAAGILAAIDSDHFEHYLPDMKAVVEMKAKDIDAFMAGMLTFARQQREAAQESGPA